MIRPQNIFPIAINKSIVGINNNDDDNNGNIENISSIITRK
jgi:hypothetical protein